jgi:Tol biopolymer transport system component
MSRRTLLLGCALALVATSALCACGGASTATSTSPSAAPAASSPPTGTPLPAPTIAATFAFTDWQSDGIALIGSDGAGLEPVADADGFTLWQPSWSPDGTRIAFTRLGQVFPDDFTVWVMNADGSGQRRLTKGTVCGLSTTWSPDGKRVALTCFPGKKGATISTIKADGTGLRVVMTHTLNDAPSWGSDGRIYFLEPDKSDVYCVDPEGGRPVRVTKSGDVGAFALSPDGKQLAIHDILDDRIELRPLKGDGEPVLLVDRVPDYVPDPYVALSWSPDGRALAFAGRGLRAEPPTALYVVNADGSGLSMVPNTEGHVWAPAWRPR